MRVTQGTFSFLPDLTDEQVEAQIRYALANGWAISVEYTDDPHPRNAYWEIWNVPLFDLRPDQADVAMREVQACRERFPDQPPLPVAESQLKTKTAGSGLAVGTTGGTRSIRLCNPGTGIRTVASV